MKEITQTKQTRIQREKRLLIQNAALEVFSEFGLRGATLDKIAQTCGLTKPNILYYYASKDEIYTEVLKSLLEEWIRPLKDISEQGDPLTEILQYVQKKLIMSKTRKQESKLFATEILHGAPLTQNILAGSLKETVDEKVKLFDKWISEEKIAPVDSYHLIFSIWSMTQHYADFDIQVHSLLNHKNHATIFKDAE
ncbi:MAG: TetR family transcriptional regulator C-terminal domain-containing protein, partial [Paracoccaceae bacterium]|nr:TetR family transcriptional regulator C-terminal domain-containing protein [Paracoccaceae bacterium]